MENLHCGVYCGEARIAFIVWRQYNLKTKGNPHAKIRGHYSVFLYFNGGECEHAIPSDNIKHARLFVKDEWKKYKKEITK
jgi:hypothetical protein